MQFSNLDLPPQPATETWLRETNSRDDVETIVPLAIEEDETAWIFGVMIFSTDAVTMLYNDIPSWNLFTEYELKHDFQVYRDDLLRPNVGIIREDGQVIKRLANQFAEKILDITGLAFAPYANPQMGSDIESSRQSCDCSSISEPQIQPVDGLSGIESDRMFMCVNCSEIHGLEYNGRPISRGTAFDANWVLEDETADAFYSTDNEEDYLLFSTGDDLGKLEYVVALMNAIGGSISNSFSRYLPDKHKALVYVKDDQLAGYLTWTTEVDDTLSLQQLFTREKHRNEGIASTLITSWEEHFCDGDRFYVEEPNSKSRSLLENLGYMDGSPEAVEHFLLRGLANEWQEGKDRAESVTGFQNSL